MTRIVERLVEEGLVARGRRSEEAADSPAGARLRVCPTGLEAIDGALPGGGLAWGRTHEWFAPERGRDWWAPMGVLAWVVASALRSAASNPDESARTGVLWVGRRCWATPALLTQTLGRDAIARSMLIDPKSVGERVWAIDQGLRCRGLAAVVADGSGLDMGASRRLQLASESGGTLGLIARPMRELKALSGATTRWVVSPLATEEREPAWVVELARCKLGMPAREAPSRWAVRWSRESDGTRAVRTSADVGDRSEREAAEEARRTPGRHARLA